MKPLGTLRAVDLPKAANEKLCRSRAELEAENRALRDRIDALEAGRHWMRLAAANPVFPGARDDVETLLDNLPGMAYRCSNDIHWTMIYMSAGCRELTGHDPATLIGNLETSYNQIIHPLDKSAEPGVKQREVSETGRYEETYRIIRADGEVRWVWDRARIVSRPSGAPIILEGFIADITALKKAEEAARTSAVRIGAIFDNSPVAIFLKDREGRYIQVSHQYEEIFKVRSEDIVGRLPADLHDPDLAARIRAQDLEVLETGGEVEREECFVIDGEERVLLVLKFPIRDRGEITGLGAIATDVTDRAAAERILRESEERLRNIAGNIPGCVYRRVLHPDGSTDVPYVSSGIELMTGVPADNISRDPKKFTNRVHPDDLAVWRETLETSAAEMSEYALDYRCIKPGGEVHWCRAHAKPHAGPDGQVIWDGVTLDVTALKETEHALYAAKEQAVDANRAKSDFLARMSHELRTPMNAIIGFSEMMRNELLGPIGNARYYEYVNDIHESGAHLLSLINEILDLSRIEAGEAKVVLEDIDLRNLIDQCGRILRRQLDEGELTLNVSVDDQLPTIRADRRMMKQILFNLLSNSEKFSEPGGRIEITARKTAAGGVAIAVSDDGQGIPEHALDRVMEPFQQVENVLTREHGGTGLGLYLVRMLVELHGGEIALESRSAEESSADHGTKVTVTLPPRCVLRAAS